MSNVLNFLYLKILVTRLKYSHFDTFPQSRWLILKLYAIMPIVVLCAMWCCSGQNVYFAVSKPGFHFFSYLSHTENFAAKILFAIFLLGASVCRREKQMTPEPILHTRSNRGPISTQTKSTAVWAKTFCWWSIWNWARFCANCFGTLPRTIRLTQPRWPS